MNEVWWSVAGCRAVCACLMAYFDKCGYHFKLATDPLADWSVSGHGTGVSAPCVTEGREHNCVSCVSKIVAFYIMQKRIIFIICIKHQPSAWLLAFD